MRLFLFILGFICFTSLGADPFEDAFKAYQKGEEAQTIEERSSYFNEALKLYSMQESENGELYYNIANCYYQLNQTGMAIWYYLKAERLLPRDVKIKENLQKAKVQAEIPISSWDGVLKRIFFFHYQLKQGEKALSFILLSTLIFVLVSFSLWIKKSYFKPLIFTALFFSAALGLSYFTTLQTNRHGLFVEPSLLRCAAGMQYKEIDNEIITSGQKFKVLEITEDGKWIKVKTGGRKKGYVLTKHIRLL